MKRVLIFIFAAISALSCSEREMSGDLKPDVVQYAEHTFEISLPLDDSTATRSVMNADPDRIKDVCAFAFDAGSGDILRYPNGGGAGDPVMTYVTGSSSFEWSLPLGVEMDIYAVCNMGQITAPSTLSAFLASPDLVYEISDVSDLDESGVPMTAVLEGIMSDSGSTLVLPARRIVSKYTVRLTDMPYDYEITGIRICNVNSRTTLFARNEAADASSVLIMGDWATEEDLAQLNSGEGAEFYMFENAQTTTGSASLEAGSKWYEVHGQLAEKADLCTYLDIISEHEGEARRDRLYLGRDCTSNFDVIRNTIRHISCPAPVSLISGAGQDVLRFAGSCDAFPGETILIPFEYNLSLSEAGPSSITFHADDGLTVGTPVFSSDANGYGTGSIPVTCGSSVSVGEKLSVRMSSGEASADTDVDIINKVISVTISSPSENVKVRSVQLQAEAVFADGTTITDPALFDWEISTSDSSTATVKDGLVSRIGYRYGPVSLTAEFGGVTSNTLQITFDSSIMELYTLPDEVSVSVGKTANMRLLYKISEIGDASGTDVKVTTIHYLNPKDVVYAIKDPDIASVTDGGLMIFKITGNRSGSTSLKIQYDSDHFGTSTLDVPVFVDEYSYELELSKTSLEMSVGSSTQLEAYFVTYYKGVEESRINVTDEAVWESSSSSHVKVTNGLVEVLMKITGDEYIYVSYNGYKTQTSVKTVEDETYLLEIYPEYISLDPGEGCQLSAILYKYINGTYVSETDVTSYVYWDVEDRSVATINTKGYLRGLSEGTTRAYADYDDYYAAATVRVSPSVPDPVITNRLVVSAGQTSFTGGGTTTATATYITYEDGVQTDSKDVTSSASWSTSNSSVATVSFGNISVKDVNGTATITATYEGKSGKVAITASRKDEPEPVVTYDLVVSAGQTSFTGGGTTTATATYITYEDGVQTDSKDVTSSASWSTSNSSVAAVSRGSIFVKDVNGSAVITATYEGKSDSVTIIAKKKDDPVPVVTYDLVVSPSGIDIGKQVQATLKPHSALTLMTHCLRQWM